MIAGFSVNAFYYNIFFQSFQRFLKKKDAETRNIFAIIPDVTKKQTPGLEIPAPLCYNRAKDAKQEKAK